MTSNSLLARILLQFRHTIINLFLTSLSTLINGNNVSGRTNEFVGAKNTVLHFIYAAVLQLRITQLTCQLMLKYQ